MRLPPATASGFVGSFGAKFYHLELRGFRSSRLYDVRFRVPNVVFSGGVWFIVQAFGLRAPPSGSRVDIRRVCNWGLRLVMLCYFLSRS